MPYTRARKGNVIAWPHSVTIARQGAASTTSTTWRLGIVAHADVQGRAKAAVELGQSARHTFTAGAERYVVDPGKVVVDIDKLTAAYIAAGLIHRREDMKALVLAYVIAGNPS